MCAHPHPLRQYRDPRGWTASPGGRAGLGVGWGDRDPFSCQESQLPTQWAGGRAADGVREQALYVQEGGRNVGAHTEMSRVLLDTGGKQSWLNNNLTMF